MININEENNLIIGTLRRVETFYEFFREKNSQLLKEFKLTIENTKAKKRYFEK
jgi:hypothetical protein